MSSWQQQDAQEYFSKVLDEIDKEVTKAASSTKTLQGFESDPIPDEASSEATARSRSSDSIPISSLRNPLEGLLAQRVCCMNCGYSEGLSMIPFNCLTVPLGKAWEYDISDCLDEYTKLEGIEGVECGKCTLLKSQHLHSIIMERVIDAPEDNPVRKQTFERLEAVTEALEDDDYEDKTLLQKCKIPAKSRISSTKSRQAVIARPPKSLVVHFNRSLFDELTGELKKNYSQVRFFHTLDLGPWCLGSSNTSNDSEAEEWLLNPDKSMIASSAQASKLRGPLYELRAVVTHYGRHENGHYICYKKHPGPASEKGLITEQWWRLSDDDVMKVSEENVLGQGGVFMLFYDCVKPATTVSSKLLHSEPVNSIELLSSADLALAAGIPLPADDKTDMSDDDQDSTALPSREENIVTSISEYDEDTNEENEEKEYRPTKAILVPPYIPSAGGHHEAEGAGQQGIRSPGNLLMV
jgi:ubiquitin carboxyl-terminal hydrolase 1